MNIHSVVYWIKDHLKQISQNPDREMFRFTGQYNFFPTVIRRSEIS